MFVQMIIIKFVLTNSFVYVRVRDWVGHYTKTKTLRLLDKKWKDFTKIILKNYNR
jgi:hypothetical protein